MTTHRYSVVMMTYNQEEFVGEALKAILEQDCVPLEILVSDDKSRDETFARVKEVVVGYTGPHHLILNRNPENLGITAHINQCFRRCSGELIIAASGDDVSTPDRIRKIIDVYERERPLLIHSRVDSASLNGGQPDPRFDRIGFLRHPKLEDTATSMSLYIGATAAWNRELVSRYGDLPERDCYEDLIFGFRAALEDRVAFIDEPLVRYRVGSGVSTTRLKEFTKADWSASRQKILRRTLVVLQERLRNARTFGLKDDHPVVQAMASAMALAQARMNRHLPRAERKALPGFDGLRTRIKAALGEAFSYRNARRRGVEG